MSKTVLGFITSEPNPDEHFQTYYGGIPQVLGSPIRRDQVICGVCDNIMTLLLQIYAPEDDIEHAYHRMVYVFVCRDGQCMTEGWSKSLRVFRGQVSKDFEHIKGCHVCGLAQTNGYCSDGHRQLHQDLGRGNLNYKVKYGFKQHFIVSEEEEDESAIETKVEDLSKAMVATKTADVKFDDFDMDNKVDKQFLKFQKVIRADITQVVRYARSGDCLDPEPLLVSSLHLPQNIPNCNNCHQPRGFEFQIMPQILMHLDIKHHDPHALDFGTIMVYSCVNSCDVSLTEEVGWQQPFSNDGIQQ